jgi:DNA-binding LytR/AlgR family response regulator
MDKKVSCLIVDDEPTAREILNTHLSKIERIQIVGSCSGAVEAFNIINTMEVNLIFLDINMPEISGLSFAKSITKDIKFIFTTAYREYAIEGFDLQAVDYLLKPISFERLFKAVNLYFEVYDTKKDQLKEGQIVNPDNFMFVRAERKMVRIDFSDIIYIESFSDYIKIHCSTETIITRETISNIELKLPYQHFIRIHRSFIVALRNIISYTHEYVEVKGKTLPIGRTNKSGVLERLEKH